MLYIKKIVKVALWPLVAMRRKILKMRFERRRSVIDYLGMIAVDDIVLRIEEFGGCFAFDARSDLFARVLIDKGYEPDLATLCLSCLDQNRDFIDVGANIGFFSVLAASNLKSGRVLSIEPMSNSRDRLRKNISINGLKHKVEIFEGAVSDKIGTTTINYIEGKEEYSSILNIEHPGVDGQVAKKCQTSTSTLDHLVAELNLNPGMIKVDAEGSEALVFKGAQETFRKHRPIILSELSDYLLKRNSSSAQEVIDLIKGLGYVICDPVTRTQKGLDLDFGEILCIPEEVYGKWRKLNT